MKHAIHEADAPRPEPMTCAAMKLNKSRDILQGLLDENLKRFALALELEKDRGLIFPETSVILRDVVRLVGILEGDPDDKKKRPASLVADEPPVLVDDDRNLFQAPTTIKRKQL